MTSLVPGGGRLVGIASMTALTMTREYGLETLLGSSPVFGSGLLPGSAHLEFAYFRCSSQLCSPDPVVTVAARSAMYPKVQTEPCGWSEGPFNREASFRRRKTATVTPPPLNLLSPGKSCLVYRQDDQSADGVTSPTRNKKKVSFADSNGLDLTQVRVFTERPDCPPRWSQAFLDQVTGGAQPIVQIDHWELTFPQPASDYLTWKGCLERDNVALENVIVKDAEEQIAGTIKVRNISYHKQVVVRYTTDNWSTHQDVQAKYQALSSSPTCSYNVYDTFSFFIQLPHSWDVDKLEFCVCYSCNGTSFWDNNNGKNYTIVCFRNRPRMEQRKSKPTSVCDVDLECWSEFAPWNHLNEQGPYW